jgi:hypothetical protein
MVPQLTAMRTAFADPHNDLVTGGYDFFDRCFPIGTGLPVVLQILFVFFQAAGAVPHVEV